MEDGATVAAVRSRMESFAAAERARDAERLLAHFADVPGFRLFNDGEAVAYAQMATGVRATFPTLRSLEGGFDDLEIAALGADHALATATFKESITDGEGHIHKSRGAASWLWRKIDGEWRIVYGQVDHRPDGVE